MEADEQKKEKLEATSGWLSAQHSAQHNTVLFAETPNSDMVVGVVTADEEPSTLTLLAAGIVGMAERRRRRLAVMAAMNAMNPEAQNVQNVQNPKTE